MDTKIKKKMAKIKKVIRLFYKDVIIQVKSETMAFERGKPIYNINEFNVKIAILNIKKTQTLQDLLYNDNSIIENKLEAYIIDSDYPNIYLEENDLIIVDDVQFKIVKIERNYKIFTRMEIVKNDKRN